MKESTVDSFIGAHDTAWGLYFQSFIINLAAVHSPKRAVEHSIMSKQLSRKLSVANPIHYTVIHYNLEQYVCTLMT